MKLLVPIGILAVFVFLSPHASFCAPQTEEQSAPSSQPSTEPAPAAPQTEAPAGTPPQTQAPAEPQASSTEKQSSRTPTPANRRKKTTKKDLRATQSGRVVVRNGGVKDDPTQLSPAMTKEQELQQRETTSQLLATTDVNLKKIASRQLTPAQQSMLNQIHTYTSQAKVASNSGDLARAQTLALKAHLLSDELARQ